MKKVTYILTLLLFTLSLQAQKAFRNLTADEVKIDSVLPTVTYSYPLSGINAGISHDFRLLYPEFIDMSADEILAYKKLQGETVPGEMPVIDTYITTGRKQSTFSATFCPVVFRDGRYQYLVSFMTDFTEARPLAAKTSNRTLSTPASSRYAEHSVLASGKWAKIRVSSNGIHELTEDVIRKAGFSDIAKVKIYGYGGNLIPEVLSDGYLREKDDLQEVATCKSGNKVLFHAKGPVSWSSTTTSTRTRNPYSDYGYYFITEGDNTPKTCTEEELVAMVRQSTDITHTLYEKDEYAWFKGGRNLVEGAAISVGSSRSYKVAPPSNQGKCKIFISTTSATDGTEIEVYINNTLKETQMIELGNYDKAGSTTSVFTVDASDSYDVTLKVISGGSARLDYISLTSLTAPEITSGILSEKLPSAEFVQNIENQDLHADSGIDMVIIIPTSQKLLAQAQRLKEFHEQFDSLKVRILRADQLFNEFSSGTPDASAFRRYMKMLYDKAEAEGDAPRHLLLFGDGSFDNRMLTTEQRTKSADDYLLCFESENSFNEVSCFVSDDFYAMLDDNEAISSGSSYRGIPDVAVGRFPCTNATDAKVLVDKTIAYATSSPSGSWQNTLMFLGDDGNNNTHMEAANKAAEKVRATYPGYNIRKVMWDAYTRVSTSTGHRYPDVTNIIKQQVSEGALIMDYAGHGSETSISHEAVLGIKDFAEFNNPNLPLWITASCDIMPFDSGNETIGETTILNERGGAVAFYGTTRTVYASYNSVINTAFLLHVLSHDETGKAMTLGEAQRLTKQELVQKGTDTSVNKLQYTLLGDPALRLALPSLSVVIDSINGINIEKSDASVNPGETVKVSGHIVRGNVKATNFNGTLSSLVHDTEEKIICRLNNQDPNDGAETPFEYKDRLNTLFTGTDSIKNGEFSFLFAMPKDLNYSSGTGLFTLYAVNNDHTESAHGICSKFTVGNSYTSENDSIGPSIYCYLNSPDFTYGGTVNRTPYFVAEIKDKDGINASGAGIGHDMQLVIDDDISKIYNLNSNFQFDFGSYTSGQTFFLIPELEPGKHTLRFRAWDIQNNPSTVTLAFNVEKGLKPERLDIALACNPVTDNARFIISHDRAGAVVLVKIEVMDVSGRLLWSNTGSSETTTGTLTYDWNLSLDNGGRLQTGVYIYRISISSDNSPWVSKAKKMLVIG